MFAAQAFHRIMVELIGEISQIIEEVKAGVPEARIRIIEWMKFFMILSGEIRFHPLDKKEAENLQAIGEEIKRNTFNFLEDRESIIKRIGLVVHILENGDWVWTRLEGYPHVILGRVEDVDHEHRQALVLFVEQDLMVDRGIRSVDICVTFPDIISIERDTQVIDQKAWAMEKYLTA